MIILHWILRGLCLAVLYTENDGYRQLIIPGTTVASQSSTFGSYNASLTIDGKPTLLSMSSGSCSHTGGGRRSAWLQINLRRVYNIKTIKFWYRNDRGSGLISTIRLHKYLLRYSNGQEWKTCYTDSTPYNKPIPMPSSIECHQQTQYISFNTNSPSPWDQSQVFLEICEVEVYGCGINQYGENCTECVENCARCHVVNGCVECQSRFTGRDCKECVPGYTGDKCDTPCTSGWYGSDCLFKCSGNCVNNEDCDHVDGACVNGCQPGYIGSSCSQICEYGWYGLSCQNQCSGHCFENQTCDNANGRCRDGCAKGWEGSLCFKACSDGAYGDNCKYNCSGHCYQNVSCDRFDGMCPTGCDVGWSRSRCNETCALGTYGHECNKTCNTCIGMTCNHVTGSCDHGCLDGWTGATCDLVCPLGYFGSNCSQECGNCENDTCHHVTGSCQGICKEGWKGDGCVEALISISQNPVESSMSMPVIVGSGVGALVVVVLIVLLLLIRIRQKKVQTTYDSQDVHDLKEQKHVYSSIDTLNRTEDSPETVDNMESTYYNVGDTAFSKVESPSDIKIGELASVIASKRKNNCQEFHKEYKSISYGEEPGIPCTIGKLPGNIPKNRFKTTFPYDHSRVILKGVQNDYINANYIQDMKGEQIYIASQGPKPNTVPDHWVMIWQDNVSVIVMLTNLIEGIKKKCEKYWPDLELEMTSGKITIQLLQEKQYAFYVVRMLKITNTQTRTTRTVTQFHYTQWPDHGVPDPFSLVIFQRHVRRIQDKYKNSPLLVHCSAGIGRTGTFLALDALHQHGVETGTVNVKRYVEIMRKNRMSMVQNAEQYIELYNALLESFCSRSSVVSRDTFMNDVQTLQNSQASLPNWIEIQFKELQTTRKIPSVDDMKEGKIHKELNKTRNILPVDKYRAVLTSRVEGRSNYYNAVFLSTFMDRDMLIAAQYPLPGNSIDLFRLLLDHESDIVVFVNRLVDIPSSSEWINKKKTAIPPYEISVDETTKSHNISQHEIRIYHVEQEFWHKVHIYEMMSWEMNASLPSDVNSISEVIRNIRVEVASRNSRRPITILSKDGVTGCGVFCAVYNALQQLHGDDEVDMPTIVRQLQIRRPEMISTVEEYRICYEATFNALSGMSTEVYSNTESVYANT
ncbi:receptor-type tyrosine-protein phosphatase epsilon-like [Ostrea edulis]|uniref:receptor-type tyrosine-protein phosphatase epsilon-like n=1 Tax=Ostrea edulis TaxID=37623 RepID=UPI0024AF836E|nr:receptor-type tyrosine-protein phosphatase epsilon-like [Ostrea edulis]